VAVTAKQLVAPLIVSNAQTTQYTATSVYAIIDKFTVTNYSASAVTISVNLVSSGDTAGNQNLIVKTRTLQGLETYAFPELSGQVLEPGDFISTLAGTATSLNMMVSGREITQ
jgi:hypothetical protein